LAIPDGVILNGASRLKNVKIETSQIEAVSAVVYRAGVLLLRGQAKVSWMLKKDGTFVTALDLRTQKLIEAKMRRIFPEYAFIGEEDPRSWARAFKPQCRIIVDPVDGTGPFARGLNYFGISLAVIDESHLPLLAIMHLPGLAKWCVASFEDQVAIRHRITRRGNSVRISKHEMSPPMRMDWRIEDSFTYLGSDAHQQLDLSAYPGKIRALGSTVAHLVLLADRTLDPAAVILTRYRIWDVAAGLALALANGLEVRNLTAGTDMQLGEIFAGVTQVPPALMVGHPKVLRALARYVRVHGG
jgi:myo-inositol-1(or 4)-monophosphatase